MCTVTWWRTEAGDYGVGFNRDEQRSRPTSIPVAAALTANGVRYVAPRDSSAGGTWLLANEHGLIAGVLNHYAAAGVRPPGARSRGGIPMAFAGCRSIAEVTSDIRRLACDDFAPFIFVVWDPTGETAWTWDGERLTRADRLEPPITTSSFRTDEVCTWRRERYRALLGASEVGAGKLAPAELARCLASYHHDAAHKDGAFNIRMRRPDARTESICFVTVTAREVRFRHQRERADAVAALDEHEAAVPRG